MALSFSTVQQAYKIFNQIEREVLPELSIPSWPTDMEEYSSKERESPRIYCVYGWGKKLDDGWENLFFLVKKEDTEVIKKFEELNTITSNTAISEPYKFNKDYYTLGWF
ncbi:hypothetical protein [Sphingobacterium spiritivorum]|uniref:hypothetical protein n=1 Tax=Sphingobacterium spiritivorum TaxID=258 RepID=UPI003DA4659E